MRNRGRHFANRVHTRQMREILTVSAGLQSRLAGLLGSTLAALALEQQPKDQSGLEKNDGQGGDQLQTILLPQGRLTKLHNTASRQQALSDFPSLQFPPIVDWCSEGHQGRIDAFSRLTS